ncbi:hypothetical protein [Streptomyces sp. BPTC-684]|uniref:hypothetical protein n=1 Tax=Streptomyces sp. BPTC-684 TaxID=3043734 RepID=UPI0024B0D595|nr:hypothetical protein [Streptomyces sp. BPTC-684]WHM41546.1 hypothetical protein QIY60_10195 [Streptomyces sp. BPTC-684]
MSGTTTDTVPDPGSELPPPGDDHASLGHPKGLLTLSGLADHILGPYRAVLYGGVLIACGHCTMAVPAQGATWAGLGPGRLHTAEFALPAIWRTEHRDSPAGRLWLLAPLTGPVRGAGNCATSPHRPAVKVYGRVSHAACFGGNGAIAVAAGLAVIAAAPRLKRTMHPVH